MKVVIDTNIIMAMLIKPGKPIDLFFNDEFEIYAPFLLIEELIRNNEIILKKSGLHPEEVKRLYLILREKIIFVPEQDFVHLLKAGAAICPDSKDVVFFCLALYLQCPLWSNERFQQDTVKVYTTHELMNLFQAD